MSSVSRCSAPWSALWIAFVTAKKSSEPSITVHVVGIPRSFSRGTWVCSSSATPPPNGVLFTWSTRAPRSGSAAARSRSTASSPADAA